jgi:hypothetical protein
VLAVIVLLDAAKEARLLPADPCLFHSGSESRLKTSKDMVREFAKKYVSGTTADLPKVLHTQGAALLHEQKPLHECAAPPRAARRPLAPSTLAPRPPAARAFPDGAPPGPGTSTAWTT